jgi:hypothetical protein
MTFAFVGPLVLLLAAAPAKGTRLEQGQKAFAEGDYSAALKALDMAVVEGNDLERVQLLRAQCFAAQQDFGHAEEAFALALEANPEASLDPTRVDPSVVKVLDGLRARTKGSLSVRSTPPGADITLDGKPIGIAPLEATMGIGRHKVEAKWKVGLGAAQSEVLVRAHRETYVDYVQGVNTVTNTPVEQPQGSLLHPFAEGRGIGEVTVGPGTGSYGGLELGGGVELKFFRVGLDLRAIPYFGLTLRAGVVVPLLDAVSLFVDAELPAIFPANPAFGIGGEGGAEWHPFRFLGVFVSLGGRHYFPIEANSFINVDRVIFSGGVRARIP